MSKLEPLLSPNLHCLCGSAQMQRCFVYHTPPAGETQFPMTTGVPYYREFYRCTHCGHFISVHTLNLSTLYTGAYAAATYGLSGIRRNFERINSLPPEKSDNIGRVHTILAFASSHLQAGSDTPHTPSVLDVGSGLCVFLSLMKKAGWECTALDLDPCMVEHAREVVGVKAHCGDFMEVDDLGRFDIITFNKVLEHVADPVAMLRRSIRFLNPGGFVYVEVPDGDAAAQDGQDREEFFIEHLHVFSPESLRVLAAKAGFTVFARERLREPSGKYTLRTFLKRA